MRPPTMKVMWRATTCHTYGRGAMCAALLRSDIVLWCDYKSNCCAHAAMHNAAKHMQPCTCSHANTQSRTSPYPTKSRDTYTRTHI